MSKGLKVCLWVFILIIVILVSVGIVSFFSMSKQNKREKRRQELSYFYLFGYVGDYGDYDGEEVEVCLNANGEGAEKIIIPDYVNGVFDVTDSDLYRLSELVVGDGITEIIGMREDWQIEKVTLGKQINYIGESEFANHHMLKEVIAEGVEEIGYRAFAGCENLTKITLSKQVHTIENMAFMDCTSLTSIILEGKNICIDMDAFQNCKNLTDIQIIGNVKEIGDEAFKNTGLTAFDFSGVKYVNSYAFMDTPLEKIFIPKNVFRVGVAAFSNTREIYVEFSENEAYNKWGKRWNESALSDVKIFYEQSFEQFMNS